MALCGCSLLCFVASLLLPFNFSHLFHCLLLLLFTLVYPFHHFTCIFLCSLCLASVFTLWQRINMTWTGFLLHRRWLIPVFLEAWQSHLSLRWWRSHASTFSDSCHYRVAKWLFLPLMGHRPWWPWIPSSISADSKPQMWKKRGTTDSDPCVTHQTYMNLTQWLPCCGLVLVRSPPVYPHDFASRAAVPPRSHLSDGCLLEASVLMPLTIDIRAAIGQTFDLNYPKVIRIQVP